MSTSGDPLLMLVTVGLGGAAGAALRYVIETWAVARLGQSWPWGTLAVNVLGSLILGLAMGGVLAAELPRWVSLLVATGFCGALTTFSSFALQVVDLSSAVNTATNDSEPMSPAQRFSARGLAYAAVSMGAGLLAAGSVPALVG